MSETNSKQLGGIDLLLLENLTLLEENNALRASLMEYKVFEKKMALHKHLTEKYNIDTTRFDFSVDAQGQTLTLSPRKEKSDNGAQPPAV